MDNKILQALGYATEKHSAFQIRTGMMIGALQFFKAIGWFEIPDMKVSGPWGQARFVSAPNGHHIIQLTELADRDPEKLEMTENHLAIHFSKGTTKEAAEILLDWASRVCAGEDASIEAANAEETKWFVYLPALFTFGIEIV